MSRILGIGAVALIAVWTAPGTARAQSLADYVASWVDGRAPAYGHWETTVTFAAPAVAAVDPDWGPSVARLEPSTITTSALPTRGEAYRPAAGPRLNGDTHALDGIASYYWQGETTAAGEPFDRRALTAAHRTLPFGTRVRVTRPDTGGSVVVRINDRGPFKQGRVIDLSEKAAEDLGMTGRGLMPVQLEVLGR